MNASVAEAGPTRGVPRSGSSGAAPVVDSTGSPAAQPFLALLQAASSKVAHAAASEGSSDRSSTHGSLAPPNEGRVAESSETAVAELLATDGQASDASRPVRPDGSAAGSAAGSTASVSAAAMVDPALAMPGARTSPGAGTSPASVPGPAGATEVATVSSTVTGVVAPPSTAVAASSTLVSAAPVGRVAAAGAAGENPAVEPLPGVQLGAGRLPSVPAQLDRRSTAASVGDVTATRSVDGTASGSIPDADPDAAGTTRAAPSTHPGALGATSVGVFGGPSGALANGLAGQITVPGASAAGGAPAAADSGTGASDLIGAGGTDRRADDAPAANGGRAVSELPLRTASLPLSAFSLSMRPALDRGVAEVAARTGSVPSEVRAGNLPGMLEGTLRTAMHPAVGPFAPATARGTLGLLQPSGPRLETSNAVALTLTPEGAAAAPEQASETIATADSLARRAAMATRVALESQTHERMMSPSAVIGTTTVEPAAGANAIGPASVPGIAAASTASMTMPGTSAGLPSGLPATPALSLLDADAARSLADTVRLTLGQGGPDGQGPRSARIDLTPVELGALSVDVEQRDGRLTVALHSPIGATRELIEALVPRLREQLANDGSTSVSVDVGERGDDGERRPGRQSDPLANGAAGREESRAERDGRPGGERQRSDESGRSDDREQAGLSPSQPSQSTGSRAPSDSRRVLDAWI